MDVQRIKHEGGSRIEPALDSSWTELKKLQWLVAVCKLDLPDLNLEVQESCYLIDGILQRGYFDVMTEHCTSGPSRYHPTRSFIQGIELGFKEGTGRFGE